MKTLILLTLVAAISSSGCDSGLPDYAVKKVKIKAEDCIPPHNPYNDGGGHDAGFNWASDNGGDCNGNSDSFNEGCEEHYRQLNEYNECIANSHK